MIDSADESIRLPMTAPDQKQSRASATAMSDDNSSLPRFDLATGDVHVWWVDLLAQLGGADQLEEALSPDELDRAQCFRFAVDRRRFVARREMRRHLIGRYLNLEPSAIQFTTGNCDKPAIAGQTERGGLRFSCSHSGDLALIAFARGREIGVDLERRRPLPDALQLAHTFFSPVERAALASVPAAQQEAAFFDCWTRKEAFIKALGLGLSFPLNRFTVSLAPDKPAALLRVEDDPSATGRWAMRSLAAAPGYSAALVADGKITLVSSWNFRPPDSMREG